MLDITEVTRACVDFVELEIEVEFDAGVIVAEEIVVVVESPFFSPLLVVGAAWFAGDEEALVTVTDGVVGPSRL
jgi:hypothetical protein